MISEIHEQTALIAGLVLALSERKRTGKVDPDFGKNEMGFRKSLHELEVSLTKGTPKAIQVADAIYAPVGVSGYLFVGVIIFGAYFVAKA